MKLAAVLSVLACVACARCADILAVFPFPAKSHHAVFQPILIALAENGHHVTYVTSNAIKNPPANLKQIELANIMDKLKERHEHAEGPQETTMVKAFKWVMNHWGNMLVREVGYMTMELVVQEASFQQLINNAEAKFDLILLETTFAQEANAALSHRFDAPIVEIMPTSNFHWTHYLHGIPYDSNYIVDIDTDFSDQMTFRERLINTGFSMLNRFANTYYFVPKLQRLADEYMRYEGWESRPPLLELVRNTSLLLINTDVAVNYPTPLPPNVQLIGGVNIQEKPKTLPKDIKDFMDGAKEGVVYFTLGSHIDVSTTLGDGLKAEFLKAFSRLRQRVLWKWETDFPEVPKNVKTGKWFPQQDILAHKNMKLFITHGGLLSITEAVYNGVPLVGIPILGDQPKNVKHIQTKGYGVGLDFTNLTDASISWAINEIINNPRYAERAKERQAIYLDRTQTPVEKAVYWIEYVLRHDGAHHLRPAVASMPWCQQALLDVYLVLAVTLFLPAAAFYLLMRAICSCFSRSEKSTKPDKKKKRE